MPRHKGIPGGVEASRRFRIEQVVEFLRMHVGAIGSGRRLGARGPRLDGIGGKRYARNPGVATSAEDDAISAHLIQAGSRAGLPSVRARWSWEGAVTVHLFIDRTAALNLRPGITRSTRTRPAKGS